jgi:oligoribonuclease NrnB/cAMP/cGMP phosphodiesterase (DHH superfamily)
MKNIIIGHRDPDGICSAFIAKMAIIEGGGDPLSIELHDVQYGEKPLTDNIVRGNNVYVLDFSYDRETMLRWNSIAEKLVVLDHHESARSRLEGLDFCTFDITKAGVRLTWEYFYGATDPTLGIEMPDMLLYVEDRDLYKMQLPDNRAYMSILQKFSNFHNNYSDFLKMVQDDEYFHSLVGDNQRAIARYQEEQIERLAEEYRWMYVDGEKVPMVNCRMWGSDVCAVLYRKFPYVPFVGTYFDTPEKKNRDIIIRVFSLRSAEDGADVSKICMKYGGGGHKHAGGFSMPIA